MFFAWLLVKIIEPNLQIVKTDGLNEIDLIDDVIYYNPNYDTQDQDFLEHIKYKHYFENPEKYSDRLWTILHEIGHYYNEDVDEKDTGCHYDSPDEFEATEWAIDWIIDHKVLARIFSNLLK